MMKVLVVDDMSANRKLLVWMLEDDGFEVIEAENGKQAVDLFLQTQPNLVLMDVMMPVMDGFTATRVIRERGDVPIIALTADAMKGSEERCREAGAFARFRRAVETIRIVSICSTEQRPSLSDPWERREFVYCRDQEGR